MSAKNDAAFLRMFLIVIGALVAFTIVILILANRIMGVVEEQRGEDPRQRDALIERIQPVGSVNVAAATAAEAQPQSGADIVAASSDAAPAADAGPVDAAQAMASNAASAVGEVASDAVAAVAGVAAAVTPDTASEPDAASAAPSVAAESATAAAPAADLAKGKSVYDVACFACHMTGAAGAPKMGDKAAWAPRIAQGMETLVHNAISGKNAMPPKGGRTDLSDQDVLSAVAYLVQQSQ